MKDYYLLLAGLRTVLRTPHDITVSDRLRPFLCAPFDEGDCTVTVRSLSVLPALSGGGLWHGLEYYDHSHGVRRVFHCHAPQGEAFAVTQWYEDGNVEIDVLPEYLSYFSGSSGIFNRIGMETLLLQHQGLLLHASLIQYNGKAIAFTGPSGMGKSTQATLWETHLGAQVLNGDRAALRHTAAGWIAYGSPYAGTSGIYRNLSAPLTAVVVLRQAQENRLHTLTAVEAFHHLYPELSIHHWDAGFTAAATDLCLGLLEQVPTYLLECRPEAEAVEVLQKGLAL